MPKSIDRSTMLMFDFTGPNNVVFKSTRPDENYGTEDPRVVYRSKTGMYYLLYSAVQAYPNGTVISRLALATSQTPAIYGSWKRYGPLFPQEKWSKSGAMLIMDDDPNNGSHYLFFGDATDSTTLIFLHISN